MKSVCRVCMSGYVTLMELFAKTSTLVEEPSLAEMLHECGGCEVQPDDPLPKMICLTCVIETKNAYRFKRKCEQSHKSFWEMCTQEQVIHKEESRPPIDTSLIKIEMPEIVEEKVEAKPVPGSSIMSINTPTVNTNDGSLKVHSLSSLLSDTQDPITISGKLNTYKCPHCPRSFKQQIGLQVHLHIHGKTPYKCRHCTECFGQQQQLEEHLQIHEMERRFECAKCLKRFSTEVNLQLHSRFHAAPQRRYECPSCLKAFGKLPSLQKHMRIHAPHKCPYCPMSFPRKQDLNYHVLVHTGDRPHRCPHCDKAFKKKQHVEYHLLTHLGQPHPFQCPQCPKTFSRKLHRDEHISMHAGVRPYQCNDCHKQFRSNAGFKKHVCLPAHNELRNAHLSIKVPSP
ncbi:hypothetical protein KR093_003999 [Drosophila rubida]|uniref:Uncharacterized protein n=1 Tax=Drosophila rubida TaxID=30044 RepID=A0AAD4PIH6_9MUSC|nr:hypothetical protein KR093_003999 [Drosophila rubida]